MKLTAVASFRVQLDSYWRVILHSSLKGLGEEVTELEIFLLFQKHSLKNGGGTASQKTKKISCALSGLREYFLGY